MYDPEVEADRLFKRLETELSGIVDSVYFDEPKTFRSLIEVVKVLGHKVDVDMEDDKQDLLASLKDQNAEYSRLLEQQEVIHGVIEEVVKFEHGLSNSVDTMGDVIRAYGASREDIRTLRGALLETQGVLTSKKSGTVPLKELWMKKMEYEETLRILKELESLKDAPLKVERFIAEKKFYNAVLTLNAGIENMFNEDLVGIEGFEHVRNELMSLKESILETIVTEMKNVVYDLNNHGKPVKEEENEEESDAARSIWNGTSVGDNNSSTFFGSGGSFFNAGSILNDIDLTDTKSVVQKINNEGASDARYLLLEEINWSMDLEDEALTAETEDSLNNPEQLGSIYIRFLIKCVSALHCELDVERMLLSVLHNNFQHVLRNVKEWILLLPRSYSSRHEDRTDSGAIVPAAESKRFCKYIKQLLNSAFLSFKRLLYILRLLNTARKMRENVPNPNVFKMKDSMKAGVFDLWEEIEYLIIDELQRHFVEKEVENISNVYEGQAEKSQAGRNKRISVGKNAQKTETAEDEEDEMDHVEDNVLVCDSTSRLAAPVYHDITVFTEKIRELFKEEVDWNVDAAVGGKILSEVQLFIDGELMPVILGSVNQVMRDLQTNTQYFSLPSADARTAGDVHSQVTPSGTQYDISDGNGGNKSSIAHATPICLAAQMCAKRAKPLFIYWLQLPLHRDAVSTILERMIRGYSAAAREEIDAFTWRWLSSEGKYKGAVLEALRKDPLFGLYREHIYDGRDSVEAYMTNPSSNTNNRYSRAKSTNFSANNNNNNNSNNTNVVTGGGGNMNNVGELFSWGALWDVGNMTSYPASSDKISKEFADISSVAAVTYGCDWLTSQLCRGCIAVTKKFNQMNKNKMSSTNSNRNQSSAANSVWAPVKDAIKDLSKLAEEGLAILRAEVQVACFYYLHPFSHLKLGSGISQEPEGITLALYQHLLTFHDSILASLDKEALAVIFSPLCTIIPRLLLRYLQHIAISSTEITENFSLDNNNISVAEQIHKDKTHILRAMVACQQNISMLLETCKFDSIANKRLQEIIADEFERVRRYVTLMDMSMVELKSYILNNCNEYSYAEYNALWSQLKDCPHDVTFERIWNTIMSRRNSADQC